jgi:putative ABC transport system permease protein
MKFLHLILRNATRNRMRTLLTVGSSAFLMFVLVFMQTALTEMEAWQGEAATHNRVAVQHSTGLATPLPFKLQEYLLSAEIQRHAMYVQKLNWFGGYYKDPKEFFANFACDHEVLLQLWDEFTIAPAEYAAMKEQKNSCILGASLARKFKVKLGDRFPLKGTIYPCDPELVIVGIFSARRPQDEEALYFRYDYLDELLGGNKIVGTYWMKARTAEDIPKLKELIDGHTKNSSDPTETMTEKEFGAQFMEMMGNVKGLVSVMGVIVLVIMTLMTANTMTMSARERVTEVAVLRTLGFTSNQILGLFVAEAVFVAMLGAAISLGLSLLLFNVAKLSPVPNFFPYFLITARTVAISLGAALFCGLLSSALPAVQSARRKIVDGLRQVI